MINSTNTTGDGRLRFAPPKCRAFSFWLLNCRKAYVIIGLYLRRGTSAIAIALHAIAN